MRRALVSLIVLTAAAVWTVAAWPRVVAIDADLAQVSVGARTRLDPPPIASYTTINFLVSAPVSLLSMVTEHVAYGELRVTPDGPYFHLHGRGDPVARDDGRIECSLGLDLDGDEVAPDDLRLLIERECRLEVQLRVWDQARVLAESSWMDASTMLRSIADRLR